MHISFYILYIMYILYVYYTLVFDNFVISDEPFVKALRNLKNSVKKLLQYHFFILYFSLLSRKLDNFTFKVLY